MNTQNTKLETRNYFVTGTDTEVGKTVVTALLALHFQESGIDVGVMKPFASGCRRENGVLISDDAEFLKIAAGVDDDMELINPARWEEPLAPLVAARRAHDAKDHWPTCIEAYEVLRSRHEIILVEGVGGALAPISERDGRIWTGLDLMSTLGLPVIIVARRTLGTINHTLLTIEALRAANLEIAGIVFCNATRVDENNVAAHTSTQVIAEMSGERILGVVPHLENLSRETLRAAAREYLHIDG